MNKKVVCIGTVIVDCILKGFDPEPVSKTGYRAESTTLFPGGEALNQAVTLAKLSMEPVIVCGVGCDRASEVLTGELERYHVDTSFMVRKEEMSTPVTVMFVDEKGDRKSITNQAHYFNFHPERNLSCLKGAGAVSLGSLFRAPFNDPEVVYRTVKAAKDLGIPVYADTKLPNSVKLSLSDLRDSLPLIDYITPNEQEAQYYSGKAASEACADEFLSFGVKNVIVKLGGNGCLFKNEKEFYRLPAEAVEAVDATGAGDNFAAGFMTARAMGMDHEKALRFANICGAICATKVGATTALHGLSQVLSLMPDPSGF